MSAGPICLRWQEMRGKRLAFSCECAGEGCPDDPRRDAESPQRLAVNINDECADALRRVKATRGIDTTEAIRRAISLLDYFEKRAAKTRSAQVERIARALYGYDNRGDRFDHASADTLAPYYDLAELALAEMEPTV